MLISLTSFTFFVTFYMNIYAIKSSSLIIPIHDSSSHGLNE